MAREKGGIDASRIASDPAFQRTREKGSEFGRAGKAGKTLRTALRELLINSADGRMVSRLTQRMVKVIQADLVKVEVNITSSSFLQCIKTCSLSCSNNSLNCCIIKE